MQNINVHCCRYTGTSQYICACEYTCLPPASWLVLGGQLCIRRGEHNEEYHHHLIPDTHTALCWIQSCIYNLLNNPCVNIWLWFWHENFAANTFWCKLYDVCFEKCSELFSESLLKERKRLVLPLFSVELLLNTSLVLLCIYKLCILK